MIQVSILGAGNVGTHIYRACKQNSEISIVQWYNRSLNTLKTFNSEVAITNSLSKLKEADLYIIAVSDDVIGEISEQFPFQDKLVVHTSGSASIHELNKKLRRGVFYPLQSFSKNAKINFKEVPICIEALEKQDLTLLKQVANLLSNKVYKVNSEQRAALHLAAVFANNFTNQLYRVAHEITETKSIDFNILKPLIQETAKKIECLSPFMAQTGPAIRNDKKTIKKHLKLLENKQHKAIYQLLTESIKKTHHIPTK